MYSLLRTDSNDEGFKELVRLLDLELKEIDGEDHLFFAQFNKIAEIKNVVVAYYENRAIGCGAIKPFAGDTMEVKRMYVAEEFRGKAIAFSILKELETWATALGYSKTILETGKKQVAAVKLYQKSGYSVIPNYGQYAEIETSICMIKNL